MAETIGLIDFGAGNLGNVYNALKASGAANISICDNAEKLEQSDRIIMPGVGAYGHCINSLREIEHMIDTLEQKVIRNAAPFLGICVGMQMLADKGYEYGEHIGLGWISGEITHLSSAIQSPTLQNHDQKRDEYRFHSTQTPAPLSYKGQDPKHSNDGVNLRIPHMGWNDIRLTKAPHINNYPLKEGEAYFLHSYHFAAQREEDVLAKTDHGSDVVAAIAKDNIIGVQFHPEKSQAYGLEFLHNFLRWRI